MSSNYNFIEKGIARLLSSNPDFKVWVKRKYQELNYLIYRKDYSFKSDFKLNKISYNEEESFFGYYDKTPINRLNSHVIFQSSSFSTKEVPNPMKEINIVVWSILDNSYKIVDSINSYNWQQGCKLMWISDHEFIYNYYDDKRKDYGAKIYNIESSELKIFNRPIYDSTRDYALSLNFERLNIARGDYAYFNKKSLIDWKDNGNDGIYILDLSTGKSELSISLSSIIKSNFKNSMTDARHKFNHIMISPDGTKFMFMHRWFTPNGQRFDTLYVSSKNGDTITKLSDDGMVSHCCWKDNDTIIAYLRDENLGDKFFVLDVKSRIKSILGEGKLDQYGDGHPSYYEDKVLFDTYPNKSRMKELFIYHLDKNKLEKIGEFYESLDYYGETRCDLHPRFSSNGEMVFFDSVHEGVRNLYMIKLND